MSDKQIYFRCDCGQGAMDIVESMREMIMASLPVCSCGGELKERTAEYIISLESKVASQTTMWQRILKWLRPAKEYV